MENKFYRELLDEIPDFIYLHDLEGRIIEVNSVVKAILGYDRESLIKENVRRYIHPSYREQFDDYLENVLATGEKEGIFVVRDAQERTHLLEYHSRLVIHEGEPVGIRGVARDVSEQKRMERALRERELLYRTLFENAEDAIFLLDKGVFIDCNPKALVMFGCGKEEIMGRSPVFFSPKFQPDGILSKAKALEKLDLVKSGIPQRFEWMHSRLDGTPFETIVSLYKINVSRREIIVAMVHDISPQKAFVRALEKSERHYREVVENANVIILRFTPDGNFTFINRFAEEFFGFPREEIVGRNIVGTIIPETGAKSGELRAMCRELCRNPERYYENENMNITKDGREVFVAWRNQPIRDKDGNLLEILSFGVDMTQVHELEDALLQAKKLEAIGTLAGGIAHDFNNILGGMMGYFSLLKQQHAPGDPHYAVLEKIEAAGAQAAELVKQLLAFSRKGKFELKPIELNKIISDVLLLLKRSIPKKIEIRTNLQENLPFVEGDPSQLNQVVMNLCLNAIQAMPDGGRLEIETFTASSDSLSPTVLENPAVENYVTVTVSDTGIGMDEKVCEHIFEPFFTTKEVGRGTGLGLATVYGIIRNHEGEIMVESEIGKGTTFKFYLPVKTTPAISRGTSVSGPSEKVVGGEGKILIVDDEAMFREMLRDVLEFLGYEILIARDGREGVEVYKGRQEEIDLVILDMNMPMMDGQEMFREIKKINPKVKALLSTGFALDDKVQALMEEGVMGFIQKPFKIDDISRAVKALMGERP